MNPNDIFWVARYANNQITPLLGPMDAHLQIILDIAQTYPGVQVWVHPNTRGREIIAYKTGLRTKEEVDAFVARVEALASVTA